MEGGGDTGCAMIVHVGCLAEFMLSEGEEGSKCLPVEGQYPICERMLLWGDLVRGLQLRAKRRASEKAVA